jgi:hypothetical protein
MQWICLTSSLLIWSRITRATKPLINLIFVFYYFQLCFMLQCSIDFNSALPFDFLKLFYVLILHAEAEKALLIYIFSLVCQACSC